MEQELVSLQLESSFLAGKLCSAQQPKGSEKMSGELGIWSIRNY